MVVIISSGFLTVWLSSLVPREGGSDVSPAGARQRLETRVYPIVLLLACSGVAFQITPY